MKDKFTANLAVLTMALAVTLSISVPAQTTQEGTGPSEQPSAPMEIGKIKSAQPAQAGQPPKPAATPQTAETPNAAEEAKPGGPSGEAPAKTDQGVGRVSMIHGDVLTQRGDSGTSSAAVLNQPVLTGDKVSTALARGPKCNSTTPTFSAWDRTRKRTSPALRTSTSRSRWDRAWPHTLCLARAKLSPRSTRRTSRFIPRTKMACTALKFGPMATRS